MEALCIIIIIIIIYSLGTPERERERGINITRVIRVMRVIKVTYIGDAGEYASEGNLPPDIHELLFA